MSYPLLFFGASAFAAATGCYVLSRGKGSLPHTVLAILFGVFAVQTFSQGMQFSAVDEEEILFWSRMGFTMTAFYLPLFVHFTLVFPRKKIVLDRKAHPLFRFIPKFVFDLDGWLISKWRYFIPMLYAPWLGIAALYILRFDLVRPQISHFWYGTEVLLLSWNFVLLLGALLLLYSGYILSNLITSYLRSASGRERRKVKLTIISMFIIFFAYMLNSIALYILPELIPLSSPSLGVLLSLFIFTFAVVSHPLIISPSPEFISGPAPSFPSGAYLSAPEEAYSAYLGLLFSGIPGLCISRRPPRIIRSRYKLQRSSVLWLSGRSAGDNPSEERLEELALLAEDFLKSSPGATIMLDGIEYLTVRYGFSSVLRFLQDLNETVAIHGGRLLVPIDARFFDSKEIGFLERELEELP